MLFRHELASPAQTSRLARAVSVVLALGLAPVPAARADNAPAPPPPPGVGQRPSGPLDVWVEKAKVDLVGHSLELKASRNLIKVTIKVTGESGAVLADDTRTLLSHPANTPFHLSWSPSSDEAVARIEVFVYDAYGFYKGFALTPWSIVIPHEDLTFATNSAVIADAESPKLDASFAKIAEAIARHPDLQGVRLFVAGHTDTVGDAAHNLRLSQQRAQAIAQWFRRRGLRIPIGWEGFGETALLIKTADNVDEPRNRRVDYILSVDEPTFTSNGFRPSWKGVP